MRVSELHRSEEKSLLRLLGLGQYNQLIACPSCNELTSSADELCHSCKSSMFTPDMERNFSPLANLTKKAGTPQNAHRIIYNSPL